MTFDEAYAKLNEQQKRAVDHIDGPLLVLAGPGTGKTQLLSARAANILRQTDANPENILCLTFTEKASTNMKERMLEMIGPQARKITVKTFHGLGAEIINEYPDYFYNAARLEPAPSAVELEIIDKLLSALPLDNPLSLKFAGQNTLVGDVKRAISKTKDAGLTPGKLAAVVEANLTYIEEAEALMQPLLDQRMSNKLIDEYARLVDELPDQDIDIRPIVNFSEVLKSSLERAVTEAQELGKAKPLSEWKREWSEKRGGERRLTDHRRNQWWQALSAVYEDYQQQMHERGYFDFADMILEVIVQLEQNETLRADVQERFNYIMIDEFQDTNDAQFRLSNLIASHPAHEGSPNIMAVGDDDQAIYRFQGAEISNAQNFVSSFAGTETIVLVDNYRSHQSVLDASAHIVDKIDHRLVNVRDDLDKELRAKSEADEGVIEHISYSTQAHEITGVAETIKAYYEQEKGDIAVLARYHDSLQQLAYVLREKGVPIRYERKSNVLEHEAVMLVHTILQLLLAIQRGQRERANHLVSNVLRHDAFGLSGTTLWELALDNNRYDADWVGALSKHDEQSVRELGQWLLELAKEAASQPLAITIEHCLGLRTLNDFRSPLKAYLLDNDLTDEYAQTISALQSLRSLAGEFAREEEPSLENFARFMELNHRHGVVIADESAFVTGENAVELMTLHKAKGLEFDTVFVMDAVESVWSPGSSRRKPPKNLESLQEYGEDTDDYGRMMFVAATRAKSNLILASYRTNEHGKEVLPSPLIHELPVVEADEHDMTLVEVIENATNWPELNHADEKLLLLPLVENYELSVTHLLNFLDLERGGPRYFIERNLLRLPDVKSAQAAYGTAMHAALRLAQALVNNESLKIALVLTEFEKELTKQQLERVEEERYLQKGKNVLTDLLDGGRLVLPPGSTPERTITGVRLGEATVRGALDRVDVTPDGVTVVDYKTGAPINGPLTTQSKTEGMKAWKHRTQLIFYALLAREKGVAQPDQQVKGQMVYLESDQPKNFTKEYVPTEEDIEQLKALIEVVVGYIQRVEWPDVSDYSNDLEGTQRFIEDIAGQGR